MNPERHKIIIEVTQEVKHTLFIDPESYSVKTLEDMCDLYARAKENPMGFIRDNDESTSNANDILNQKVSIIDVEAE